MDGADCWYQSDSFQPLLRQQLLRPPSWRCHVVGSLASFAIVALERRGQPLPTRKIGAQVPRKEQQGRSITKKRVSRYKECKE